MTEMVALAVKDFKTVIINVLNINKVFKENINIMMREMEDTKRN